MASHYQSSKMMLSQPLHQSEDNCGPVQPVTWIFSSLPEYCPSKAVSPLSTQIAHTHPLGHACG